MTKMMPGYLEVNMQNSLRQHLMKEGLFAESTSEQKQLKVSPEFAKVIAELADQTKHTPMTVTMPVKSFLED